MSPVFQFEMQGVSLTVRRAMPRRNSNIGRIFMDWRCAIAHAATARGKLAGRDYGIMTFCPSSCNNDHDGLMLVDDLRSGGWGKLK